MHKPVANATGWHGPPHESTQRAQEATQYTPRQSRTRLRAAHERNPKEERTRPAAAKQPTAGPANRSYTHNPRRLIGFCWPGKLQVSNVPTAIKALIKQTHTISEDYAHAYVIFCSHGITIHRVNPEEIRNVA